MRNLMDIVIAICHYYKPIEEPKPVKHNALYYATHDENKPNISVQFDYDNLDFINLLSQNMHFLNNYLLYEDVSLIYYFFNQCFQL